MKYKLSKGLDLNELYWLLKDIEHGVAHTEDTAGHDWEIIYYPTNKVVDIDSWDNENKVTAFMKELKRGSIFPPITINKDRGILSGSHRIEAHRRMGWKEIATCRPLYAKPLTVGKPEVIKDEVYAPLVYKAKMLPDDKPDKLHSGRRGPTLPDCLSCGDTMRFYDQWTDPPPGNSRGPYWYCDPCKIIYSYKTFLGHAVIKN